MVHTKPLYSKLLGIELIKYGSPCASYACMLHAFNTNASISAKRYQIEIKLPFRNDTVFVLKVLSISFNFKELLL